LVLLKKVDMSKSALITGINGQDVCYLTEQFLDKDDEVFGLVRRLSTSNSGRNEHTLEKTFRYSS